MRILLLGATGTVGSALFEALAAAGHALVVGARDPGTAQRRWPKTPVVCVDFADPLVDRAWPDALCEIDVVINAIGIFDVHAGQTFDALHVAGPVGLFRAADALGVRIIQVSALGAEPDSRFGYMASKGRAEAALERFDGPHTIVRPSLVFAPEGTSTGWFALLAALPLTPLPGGGKQRIQPIHLRDLCEAVVRIVGSDDPPRRLDAVGPEPITLRDYLRAFKQGLRLPGTTLSVPMSWVRAFSAMAVRFMPIATPDALAMLEAGNTADARPLAHLLGRTPAPVASFFDDAARSRLRRAAQLAWLVPLLRLTVAITWIVTGIVSAFVYPTASSLALLSRTELEGTTAIVALYGAAAIDIALGVATLMPRLRRWSYRLQILLIVFYTVVITVCLPEFWAHPYGPILKNLPLLAAIAALHELDDAHGPDRR